MGGFWERYLGVQPAPPPQSATPASSRPWWAGDQPVVGQQAAGDITGPYPTASPEDELAGHDFSGASHLKQTGRCPECGSGNFATVGKVTTKHLGQVEAQRCFECGWPAANSERGAPVFRGEDADGRARQIAEGGAVVHNYHPQDIRAGAIRTAGDLRIR